MGAQLSDGASGYRMTVVSPGDESADDSPVLPGRLERLRAELHDEGIPALEGVFDEVTGLVELAYALRPPPHEGRAPAYGSILMRDAIDPKVLDLGPLDHEIVDTADLDPALVRQFADGTRTFVVRDGAVLSHVLCFGRAMTREYDLVILQDLLGAVIVQRAADGLVRTYGPAGVVRWDGVSWHHDQPIETIQARLRPFVPHMPDRVLRHLLMFAVHELGPRRIGATLVWRPRDQPAPQGRYEPRYARVPTMGLRRPGGPAAVANALAQTDGAALFDDDCVMRALGVHLVPSMAAKQRVDLVGGTRHTSALRYSFDDLDAVLVVVSGDGPVSVMHAGQTLLAGPGEVLIG